MNTKHTLNQTLKNKGYTKKDLAIMWGVSVQTVYNRMSSMPTMFMDAVQGLPFKPHGKSN